GSRTVLDCPRNPALRHSASPDRNATARLAAIVAACRGPRDGGANPPPRVAVAPDASAARALVACCASPPGQAPPVAARAPSACAKPPASPWLWCSRRAATPFRIGSSPRPSRARTSHRSRVLLAPLQHRSPFASRPALRGTPPRRATAAAAPAAR